jgi:hypothetical protein
MNERSAKFKIGFASTASPKYLPGILFAPGAKRQN